MFSITIFESKFDNTTTRRVQIAEWSQFVNLLKKLSLRQFEKKTDAELISPATYTPAKLLQEAHYENGKWQKPTYNEESYRRNTNVLSWGKWCAIDVDTDVPENVEKFLQDKIGHLEYFAYSTASASKKEPKLRVVIPLTQEIPAEKIKHFWFALVAETQLTADQQCKDLSRMYYTPATYKNAHNFFIKNRGQFLNPTELLNKHPFIEPKPQGAFARFPKELREALLKKQKNTLTNFDVSWHSYKDCPFVPRRLLQEYDQIAFTDNSGRYHHIYKMMVAIAKNAVKKKYPICAEEISELVRQIDGDRSNLYQKRPLLVEAQRAIDYAFSFDL